MQRETTCQDHMNRSFKLEEFHFFFIKFSCMVIEYKGKYTLFVDLFFFLIVWQQVICVMEVACSWGSVY